jgi:hypothetical protein
VKRQPEVSKRIPEITIFFLHSSLAAYNQINPENLITLEIDNMVCFCRWVHRCHSEAERIEQAGLSEAEEKLVEAVLS